ncbi:MAG: two-component system, cell cycle response regulator [Solirubrobacteraceae bacterium]|jgi:diguanylate cyclase (GGDEF)-like protein|nr:two-component system, cell cycle response regulator [Solirubrobacteraceae bacterium]
MREEGDKGTWLCPTPFDRTRLLDMEARLSRARQLMYGAIGAGLILCGPSLGWWILAPLAVAVLAYLILQRGIGTSEKPEYLVAATVLIAQLMIGVGIAMTGGPSSPAIPLLLLSIVTLPARFGSRGVQAGVVSTLVIMFVTTVGVDPSGFIAHPESVSIAIAALVGLSVFSDGLMRAEVESRSSSGQDPLTGLLNRKALDAHFAEVAKQAELTGRSVCMVLMDLDHFKAVNDEHGHSRGDAVLRGAAEVMRANLRSFELVYRVGGEEFLVLMPGVDRAGGRVVADRLRTALEDARCGDLEITASFGVAMATGTAVAFEPLFNAADEALYRAKDEGRNRVILAPELRPEPTLATEPSTVRANARAASAA